MPTASMSDSLDPRHPFMEKSQVAAVEDRKIKLAQVSAVTTRAFVSPK